MALDPEQEDELRWLGVEDVLRPEVLEQFQAVRKALWDNLVRVHTNLLNRAGIVGDLTS